jgi:hypothetical protein
VGEDGEEVGGGGGGMQPSTLVQPWSAGLVAEFDDHG